MIKEHARNQAKWFVPNFTNPLNIDNTGLEKSIKEAIQGNEKAFEMLYQLYVEKIFNYCLYRVTNVNDAEDLTAQVFFRAWRGLNRYQSNSTPFLAWLYRIAHNRVVDYFKERHWRYEVADAGLEDSFLENLILEETSPNNPLQNLLAQSEQVALVRALNLLSQEQRQLIYFRYIENFSHAQIAKIMGKKEGAIRTMQFRCLERLGKLLAGEFTDQ